MFIFRNSDVMRASVDEGKHSPRPARRQPIHARLILRLSAIVQGVAMLHCKNAAFRSAAHAEMQNGHAVRGLMAIR
ncbi:hypothetical protein ASE23_09830 [Rhizobium sp. Root73]|nr:hypothetical protein ASD36_12055 [Rhizobium sp. Root1334]KRC01788.1 hypothetical protein ASE23_09830 [Rhizobium sp. Root73]